MMFVACGQKQEAAAPAEEVEAVVVTEEAPIAEEVVAVEEETPVVEEAPAAPAE